MDTSGKCADFITGCLIKCSLKFWLNTVKSKKDYHYYDEDVGDDDNDNDDDDDDDVQQGGDDHDDEVLPGEAGDHRG